MRVLGGILIVLGLILCLTIIGAFFGIPMILIGIVLVALGGRRKTIIQNVVTVTNTSHPSPHLASMSESDLRQPALANRPEPLLEMRQPMVDGVAV